MSLSASCGVAPQKRTLSSLLAGRVVKRPRPDAAPRLQEAALQLLEQQQDLRGLLREVWNRDPANIVTQKPSDGATSTTGAGPLLAGELRRRASQLGVPAAALAVKMTLERLTEIVGSEDEDQHGGVLASSQRVQLGLLLESSRELMSQGALSPLLLWQEYRRDQTLPHMELVLRLHSHNILSLTSIIETDEDARLWLVSGMKALCGWTSRRDEETDRVRQEVMSTVVGVLVGSGFDPTQDPAAPDRRAPPLCCSVLDDMLSWLLDAVEDRQGPAAGAELWIRVLDASLCGASASAESLRRFFTHALTRTLTHKPRLTVSDAIALQKEWTFAKAERSLTALFRKLAVVSSVEQLLRHLQQVLETHEVNWKHVLSFLSTLLVYNPGAQRSLTELLSRLLSSAFQGYDLENMITAFLLARQGALEGPAIFPSYSTWFKMSFGGGSCLHAGSKKSVVFLLKFLSDLVPFEPSQYLKVHVLQPPYVRVKHRGLLMEYVSLAKTRLADLKESVEDMGLYEDGSGGAALQPQCQAAQDVERAVSLFESTGRISATVMEASIFRRPYFLAWFLSALMTPRTLPVKADARMSFIEALRKADKIPAAQHSSYLESCHKHRQQNGGAEGPDASDEPLEVLKKQLQECTELLEEGRDGEMSAQLSRVSHTLSAIFPGHPDEPVGRTVIELHTSVRPAPELHVRAVNLILRSFCRCVLEASRGNAPSKQSPWASRFVGALLGNTQLVSGLLHAVWDLFHNQASLLSPAHLLGLAAFVVHLHAGTPRGPLVLLAPPTAQPEPVGVAAALSSALVCSSQADMLFCIRLCVAAVCYGICRGGQQQDYIPHSLYKKLLFLIPRLVPEARGSPVYDHQGARPPDLWASATDASATWRKTAWRLWRHPAFRQLESEPQYQLSFSEWLDVEIQVQRSEDALTDPERQQYQQWACCQLYLSRPVQHGGCGGDSRALCSHLFSAVMEQQLSNQKRPRGSCLPDLLARLQEVVYDMEVTDRSSSCDFLLDLLSQRCSRETSQQLTLNAWNRVLLALPAVLLVKVKSEGGGASLDCDALIEHVNLHQRKACSPAGLLSCHLTSHLLRGLLGASARCRLPGEEVNRIWSQISQRCPLLLLSTAHWWECVSPVLSSLWSRLCDGAPLPEQLQLLSDCHTWACSLGEGLPSASDPAAGALLLAASLHRAWSHDQDHQDHQAQRFTNALKVLQPETSTQHQQVLVFLLFLCVQDHLTSLLYPQERSRGAEELCSRLLVALVDSTDWLLVFQPHDQGVYQLVAMAMSDEMTRLMPWAFYSLLLPQRVELLQRAVLCPGFLATAVLCYLGLLRLHLDGRVTTATGEPHQVEPSRILSGAKQFLLRAAPQAPPTALCSSRLRQLRPQCADLDPEVAAALATHLDPHDLSPEMDFL
ncbi:Fanconi anemia group A protein isoform X2 [Pseudoliparis swirei]|uniref:Fanconi anemia group A protein isoform X2 n=1 Tax=Pseudoliparis swirei TaxID=2059687 RepID=UPI0024BE8603|nr:Fanconi anemia group A protein isoform X2 [Pseudoliparis swirei]